MALNAQNGIAGALHRIAKIAAVPAGHDERLIVVGLSHVQAHNIRKRHFGTLGRSLHAYFALEVDGRPVFTSEETDDGTDWKFPEILKLCVSLVRA
ncbi:hypothetical protein PHLGIDRAFT_163005 [Phlebiopsis gigantea 11061_1 CR5-6]|uniref:Uncharacterized protein n=1 Tax=Phlebiopsis gigantea (strain 11061_1 CR5-6) TaxID=745531 RepID=A0A0C3NJV1_PHLG1|nr:hypothetical protein PHLGIDRAFT_163005 [Phlebiopsis gigantea 11061_1 CR5-6]